MEKASPGNRALCCKRGICILENAAAKVCVFDCTPCARDGVPEKLHATLTYIAFETTGEDGFQYGRNDPTCIFEGELN